MDNIITQMVALFFIVMAGYIACKRNYMDEKFDKKLSDLIIDITCPALILSSVMGKQLPDSKLILPLFCVGLLTYTLITVVAILVPMLMTKDKDRRGMLGFMLAFGNVGFIGYPVAAAFFGVKAIFYAAVINFSNSLFLFLVGAWQVSGDSSKAGLRLKTFFSPVLIACYLAIFICIFDIHIPAVIGTPFQLLGQFTVPGSLFVIGSSMARMPLRKMLGSPVVYVASVFRLLIIPISFYYLFLWFGIDPYVVKINTILIGMPVAAFGVMFCNRFNRDPSLIVEGTFITTIASIVTIPLISLLF